MLHYTGAPIGGLVGVTNGQNIYVGDAIDRGLPAGAVASIALSILFAVSWTVYRKHSRWVHWLIGIFVAVVIVLQHRTVWAMLAIALASASFIDSKMLRYFWKIGGAVILLASIGLFSFIGLRTKLAEELHNSATNADTLQWRIEGWKVFVTEDQSLLTVLIGQPVGSGFMRLDPSAGGYTNFAPHNEIITQYLRVGALGVVLVVLFSIRPIYIYFRYADSGSLLYPTPASWILVTIGVIVFGVPYNYSLELFALVAMANGLTEMHFEETFHQVPSLPRSVLARG